MDSGPKYDIALSFAGEDRDYIEQVANCLRSGGIRVFYDAYEEASLWGKDLYVHLSDIYRKQALFTIIFISHYYAAKLWTNHERKSAQARAFSESREYILPVRFDDTEVPGILPTVGYVNLRHKTPLQLCELVKEKLRSLPDRPTFRPSHREAPEDTIGLIGRIASYGPLVIESMPDTIRESVIFNIAARLSSGELSTRTVLIDPQGYGTIRDLLDDLFIHYLSDIVKPYTYGDEWVLMGDRGFSGNARILVPAAWVGQPCTSIMEVALDWMSSSLTDLGISHGTYWKVSACRDDTNRLLLNNCSGGAYALGCNDLELRELLLARPKAAAKLLRTGHLKRIKLDEFRPHDYKHVDVIRDWLSLATGAAVIETGEALSDDLRSYFKQW